MRLPDAIEHSDSAFGIAPESFDAVDVVTLEVTELILAMIYPVVLVVANIDESVISSPAIRVYFAIHLYYPLDNGLQDRSRTVRNDFRVNSAAPFVDTENGLFPGTTATLQFDMSSAYPTGAKVAFIQLYHTG